MNTTKLNAVQFSWLKWQQDKSAYPLVETTESPITNGKFAGKTMVVPAIKSDTGHQLLNDGDYLVSGIGSETFVINLLDGKKCVVVGNQQA